MSSSEGKILLVVGPQSSGKSTLTSYLTKSLSNCRTINRKKIISEVNKKVNDVFLRAPLDEIYKITRKKVETLNQLQLINESKFSSYKKDIFSKQKKEILEIVSSNSFNEFILKEVFSLYYQKSHGLLSKGQNIVIDDMSIDSDKSYNDFKKHFIKKTIIKKALIFNTLDNLLSNYIKRNNKFIDLLENKKSLSNFFDLLQKKEIKAGNSEFMYRPINNIIENYKVFYQFSTEKPEKSNLVLQKLSHSQMGLILSKIIKAQLYFQKKLEKWDFFTKTSSMAPLALDSTLNSIFGKSDKIYITSKLEYDYFIINSPKSWRSLADSPNFEDIIPTSLLHWLEKK